MKKAKDTAAPKKATEKSKKEPKPKGVLKGFLYAFHKRAKEEGVEVTKIPTGKGEPEAVYTVTPDEGCSCEAGKFGNECRHEKMVKGTFEGNEVPRARAEELLEEYLDKFRDDGYKAAAVGGIPYGDAPVVRIGEAVACAPDSEAPCVIYGEYKGLLVKMAVFTDETKFKDALYSARAKWANRPKKAKKRSEDDDESR